MTRRRPPRRPARRHPGPPARPATTTGATTGATTAPGGTAPVGIKGGILRVGTLGGANDLLDGQHIVSKSDIARQATGWEPLLNYDPDYNVVNTDSLAEELETVAADHYVVRLKEGLMFSDGKPVRAEDVIYSFTAHARPRPGRVRRFGAAPDPGPDRASPRSTTARSTSSSSSSSPTSTRRCAPTRTAIVPEGYEPLRRRSDQPDRHRAVQAAGVRGRRAVDPHPQRELLADPASRTSTRSTSSTSPTTTR